MSKAKYVIDDSELDGPGHGSLRVPFDIASPAQPVRGWTANGKPASPPKLSLELDVSVFNDVEPVCAASGLTAAPTRNPLAVQLPSTLDPVFEMT